MFHAVVNCYSFVIYAVEHRQLLTKMPTYQQSGRFSGKTFVITGEPDDYGKDGAKEIIENFGGVVRGAVSGKADYLLVGAYAGEKKLEKARELGIHIIDADDFEQMIS